MIPEIKDPIAYFCNEFGIDNDLPTYSGGLGILAADILNAAADQDFPFVGVGILYKGKEFMQHISKEGKAETRDSEFDHDTSFLRQTQDINGKPLLLTINLGEEKVMFKSYHVRLSDSVILFFLSTDVDGNPREWIEDMDALYKGEGDSMIRQQILLGVGGIKLLNALGINPKLYHINEGRPSFIIWELAKKIAENENISFEESMKNAREKIIYTNHTLVSAGNPTYPIETIKKWAEKYAIEISIDPNLLINSGLIKPDTFDITFFALNNSKKHSCVSKIHTKHSENQWTGFKFIPITNAVHMPRWQDSDFRKSDLKDEDLWNLHFLKKKELMETVKKRTGIEYDPSRLVVTWARRLADYKQPRIIFSDIKRLKNILSNPNFPVQILFAGNSHTGDKNAASIIEEIIRIFSNDLSGYAIFVPNYNISLANHFTSGSDIWLNTPKGNLEACGTSGMKAAANGVINCTVLDGWTYEVDWENTGFVLEPENIAESFYKTLEEKIVPLYYQKNPDGLPLSWIEKMKRSIEISKNFGTERLLGEYIKLLYT